MTILKKVQNTKIYKESTKDENIKYFDIKYKKFLHNTDNIYYSVYLENDTSYDVPGEILEFVENLKMYKENFDQEYKDSFWYDHEKKILFTRKCAAKLYNLCLTVNGSFDIFIASSIPNDKTPRIHVQIRSELLWSVGYNRAIQLSYDTVKHVLSQFDINIHQCKENRIDFAYHTNAIENPDKYFSDDNLNNHLVSSFKVGSKIFNFAPGKLDYNYLSLGMRTSNNVFFRTYNKTREVLDESKKYYFFEVWLSCGLISFYDYHVYTYSKNHKKQYASLSFGMADFYINYGKDIYIKNKLINLINNPNTNATYLGTVVKELLPFPTQIINIEFQTMRKFYFTSENIIDSLTFRNDIIDDPLVRLFQILDNRKIFLDYLTNYTVCFRKYSTFTADMDSPYLDFWDRLRKTKLEYIKDDTLVRNYPLAKNEIKIAEYNLRKALARCSCLSGNIDTDINQDFSVLMNMINDNNVNDEGIVTYIDEEYIRIKDKEKKKILKFQVAEPKKMKSSLSK